MSWFEFAVNSPKIHHINADVNDCPGSKRACTVFIDMDCLNYLGDRCAYGYIMYCLCIWLSYSKTKAISSNSNKKGREILEVDQNNRRRELIRGHRRRKQKNTSNGRESQNINERHKKIV